MGREHLYKAKRVDWRELSKEGWWVEGALFEGKENSYIFTNVKVTDKWENSEIGADVIGYLVDPETVCEYTGLTDKSGGNIFENDIIGRYSKHREEWDYGVVKYGEFNCSCCSGVYGWYFDDEDIRDCDMYEVRGNVFDNPELLQNNQEFDD